MLVMTFLASIPSQELI